MSTSRPLVLLTCVVASVCYVGAISQTAFLTLLLPATVLVGIVTSALHQRLLLAIGFVAGLSLATGEVVNIASGDYQGPAARSAGVAALCTGLAVLLSSSRRPATFLLPVVGIVAWALALGAGGRVQLVSVVTAAMCLISLAAVERDRRQFIAPPRLPASTAVVALLVLVTGVAVARYQLTADERGPASPFRSTLVTTVHPPAVLSLGRHHPPSATKPLPAPVTPASPVRSSTGEHRASRLYRQLGLSAVVLLGLSLILLLLRLLWVTVSWRLLRRRLRQRCAPEKGAWLWAVATMSRLGSPLPMHASPDVVASSQDSFTPAMLDLAGKVGPAIFSAVPGGAPRAWDASLLVASEAWESAGSLRRARARWHRPERMPL